MLINNLKSDCTSGYDNISAKIVKQHADRLVPPITHICNVAISTGKFPLIYKKSQVLPIFKSGDRSCINNYRPISILPTFSKILERVMNNRLNCFLEKFCLLSESQFGFRSKKSTTDAVHELTNYIVTNLDNQNKVIVIFLDIAKAFDTVSVSTLLEKLERMGVRGVALDLFADYLKNRVQYVKINKYVSKCMTIAHGVPQGSILGPTLFLTYINDLCELKLEQGKIITFADDTALLFNGKNWEDVYKFAQLGFNKVATWLNLNFLSLNVEKTKYLTFTLSKLHDNFANSHTLKKHSCFNQESKLCSCPELQSASEYKYLGVLIDDKLNFRPHINLLANRIRKLMFLFKNIRHIGSEQLIKTVYFAMCQSLLTYCNTSWGGAPKSIMIDLERAQRAVLKVSLSLPFTFPTFDLYKKTKVLTVRQLFILNTILKKHSSLEYNLDLVTVNAGKRRKGNVCQTKFPNTKFSRRFFCFLGCYLYNKCNKSLSIYSLNKSNCKSAVSVWLNGFDYSLTEDLLSSQT